VDLIQIGFELTNVREVQLVGDGAAIFNE